MSVGLELVVVSGRVFAIFDDRDPAAITFQDVQEWVNGAGLSPASLRVYRSTLRQIFDFAGVEPNPTRDRRVRLPFEEMEETIPPTGKQVLAILDKLARKWRLPLILMEQTSLEPQLLEVGPDAARGAMVRACLAAGVPRFTPYDLRHRRTSLWHGQGVPTKELMRRTGHSKSSTTIDVYSHANFDLT